MVLGLSELYAELSAVPLGYDNEYKALYFSFKLAKFKSSENKRNQDKLVIYIMTNQELN